MRDKLGKMVWVSLVSALVVLVGAIASQAKETYKIGALFSVTGPAAFIGEPERNSAQLMVDEVNKNGGIDGHPVELYVYDTQGDSARAMTAVKKLITKDKVHVIVGPSMSGATLAMIPVVEKAEIPLISCGSVAAIVVPAKKWIFKTPPLDIFQAKRLYDYMGKQGIKKIALLTVNNAYGDSGRKALESEAGAAGIEIVATEGYGPKDSDMTAQLTHIAGTDAQALVVWGVNPGPALIANARKQLGLKIPLFLCEGIASRKFLELAAGSAEGAKFAGVKSIVAQDLPEGDPQKKHISDFRKIYIERYGEATFSTFAGTGSDAMLLALEGLRKGGADRAKIRDAIENIKNLVGFHGIFSLSPQDHNGLSQKDTVMIQIKGDKFMPLNY